MAMNDLNVTPSTPEAQADWGLMDSLKGKAQYLAGWGKKFPVNAAACRLEDMREDVRATIAARKAGAI
jgi:hypothetical protein